MIPTSNQSRAVTRRARQNKSSGRLSLTKLCSTLKTQLVGRQEVATISTNGTGGYALQAILLDPVSMALRPSLVSAAFERYKILQMDVHFISVLPSTISGLFTFGVHDDAVAAISPTSAATVLNLRVSTENDAWKNATVSYVPIDKDKWYYVNADSVGDPRFVNQATLYIAPPDTTYSMPGNTSGTYTSPAASNTPIGRIVVEYHYVFDGATLVRD